MEDLRALWRALPEASRPFFEETHLKTLMEMMGKPISTEILWDFMRIQRQLQKLRGLTFAPQRSAEWLAIRKNLLTASDLAGAVNKSKFISRPKLIQNKAEARVKRDGGASVATTGGAPAAPAFKHPALAWGTMFEPMIARIYSEMNGNIELYEFGLIPHPTLKCFGASPDGITAFGKMVEIKCPWRRVIQDGEVPEQYYLQIQGQLSVCCLDECDYIEVVMDDIPSESAYYERVDKNETHAHGVILELQTTEDLERDGETYDYSPPGLTPRQAYEWARTSMRNWIGRDPNLNIRRVRPWRMLRMNLVPVKFNPELWDELVPKIETFWREVEARTLALEAEAGVAPVSDTAPMDTVPAQALAVATKGRSRKQAKYTYRDDDDAD